jgi:hypothetical protein
MVVQDAVRSSPIVWERARHVHSADREWVYVCVDRTRWSMDISWLIVLRVRPVAYRTNVLCNSSALAQGCALVCQRLEVWDDGVSLLRPSMLDSLALFQLCTFLSIVTAKKKRPAGRR